ncbi:MAG: hypothetical protein NVSMB65_14790 [Chloroflexota bacterium]
MWADGDHHLTGPDRGLRRPPGARLAVQVGDRTVTCRWVDTFGAADVGSPAVLEDSYWRLCVAINRASAAAAYGAAVGTAVVVRPLG